MDVSIIIVNYNTLQLTQNCIDSIYRHTEGLEFEVIVIDNNSSDNSKAVLEQDPRIKYIYSKENMGFGRANNVGMMLARGDYFFLLNSDTLLVNNAIKEFYDKVSSQPQLAFYGGLLLDHSMNVTHSYSNLPTMYSELNSLISSYALKLLRGQDKQHLSSFPSNDFFEVGYVTGADLFFNRKLYDKFGGFDSSFFLYYEETDWQARLKKEGIKSYILQGPSIIHLEGASSKGKNGKKKTLTKKIYEKSKFHYFDRHYNVVYSYCFRVLYNLLAFPIYLYRSIHDVL